MQADDTTFTFKCIKKILALDRCAVFRVFSLLRAHARLVKNWPRQQISQISRNYSFYTLPVYKSVWHGKLNGAHISPIPLLLLTLPLQDTFRYQKPCMSILWAKEILGIHENMCNPFLYTWGRNLQIFHLIVRLYHGSSVIVQIVSH